MHECNPNISNPKFKQNPLGLFEFNQYQLTMDRTYLLLQSSTTTLSGFMASTTRSTSAADKLEICVVPSNHICSGSMNSILQAGTGPKSLFSIKTKLPLSAKSRSWGWTRAIVARESSRIWVLKLNSGGGGLIETETLDAFEGLG